MLITREWFLCMGPDSSATTSATCCISPDISCPACVSLHNNEPRNTVQRNARDTVWQCGEARAPDVSVRSSRRKNLESQSRRRSMRQLQEVEKRFLKPAHRRNLRGWWLRAKTPPLYSVVLSKFFGTSLVGTLQKSSLERPRTIIKEVRGHF